MPLQAVVALGSSTLCSKGAGEAPGTFFVKKCQTCFIELNTDELLVVKICCINVQAQCSDVQCEAWAWYGL